MKKLFILLLTCNFLFTQTQNENFLDGTIIFKLKEFVDINQNNSSKSFDGIGLQISVEDYPEISEIFKDINIIKFERPSYYTGKRELQKIYRITFHEIEKIDQLISDLKMLEIIDYVEKEPIYKNSYIPNDTYHSGPEKWYHDLINSEDAWDISLGSEGIKIAIVDNAVATNHADFSVFKQIDIADNDNDASPPQYYSQSFDWSHGTHCAGLATAETNNSNGIASIGGNSQLIAVKATGDNQNARFTYYGYAGVQWACENGANVVSMSYGSEGGSNAMQELINAYPEITFVAAAGNDGVATENYPAAYGNVIGVGSVDANDLRSSFSNFNNPTDPFPWVDVAAPGGFSNGGLLSAIYTEGLNGYTTLGGTSMATPVVAGLAGLMLSVNPGLTPNEILDCLTSSGEDINQGIGPRINAYEALLCVQPQNDNPIPAFSASPQVIYENQAVLFTNNTINANNWVWTFEGGTPNSYEGQNPPEVTYSNIGTYNVSLTATNSAGVEETLVKENYITVYLEPSGAWILQNTNFETQSTGINYISIANENVVWATGFDGTGAGLNMQQFTKTIDGGNNWESSIIDIGNTNLGISMIHGHDSETAWLVAYPRGTNQVGGIFKTTDGGQSWSRQDSANYNTSSSFANVVYFWDENVGFAQGDPINGEFELYVTSDGGSNWNQVPGSSIPNPLGGEYGYTRQIEVVGDNVWFTTNRGRVFVSADRGNNWDVYETPLSDFGGAEENGNLSFSDSQNGIIINNNANVYRSYNGGFSWEQISTDGLVYTSGLCFIEGTNIVFSTGAGSSFSPDGGFTWGPIDTSTHLYVDFFSPEMGWSGGWTQVEGPNSIGGVWKWEDYSLGFDDPENYFDFDYYPNPTQDIVSFNYDGDISITVYDILGKEILVSNEKSISLANYKSGVYIFKIQDYSNQKIKTIRIIKK